MMFEEETGCRSSGGKFSNWKRRVDDGAKIRPACIFACQPPVRIREGGAAARYDFGPAMVQLESQPIEKQH
jgi:hypothetical protein